VEVLAVAGWVGAVVHVPAKTSLAATLNKKAEFLALTEVVPEPGADVVPFLAIRRQAILLMVPSAADVDLYSGAQHGVHGELRITCLLQHASVEGTVRALAGQRVSDFLETNAGFVLLSNCSLTSDQGGDREGLPYVFVNMCHVMGVMESAPDEVAAVRESRLALAAR
jgi:hypothetical protein